MKPEFILLHGKTGRIIVPTSAIARAWENEAGDAVLELRNHATGEGEILLSDGGLDSIVTQLGSLKVLCATNNYPPARNHYSQDSENRFTF